MATAQASYRPQLCRWKHDGLRKGGMRAVSIEVEGCGVQAPAKNLLKAATSQMVDASASVNTVRRAFSEKLKATTRSHCDGNHIACRRRISHGFCKQKGFPAVMGSTLRHVWSGCSKRWTE